MSSPTTPEDSDYATAPPSQELKDKVRAAEENLQRVELELKKEQDAQQQRDKELRDLSKQFRGFLTARKDREIEALYRMGSAGMEAIKSRVAKRQQEVEQAHDVVKAAYSELQAGERYQSIDTGEEKSAAEHNEKNRTSVESGEITADVEHDVIEQALKSTVLEPDPAANPVADLAAKFVVGPSAKPVDDLTVATAAPDASIAVTDDTET